MDGEKLVLAHNAQADEGNRRHGDRAMLGAYHRLRYAGHR